ncbi:MAG: TonB-dependent receptor [Niastella sp.]|nr:TonB-dependent receptor [Niastella sp.]
MKLNCLIIASLLCTANLLVASPGNAQILKETKVTVGLRDESLKNAFAQIEKQTSFRFAYVESQITPYKKITLPLRSRSLLSTLEILFDNTLLEYSVRNNTIVVVEKVTGDTSADGLHMSFNWQAEPPVRDAEIKVNGIVTDNKKQPLAGVSVTEKGTDKGVTSGADGSFSIRVAEDATLVFSYVGYKVHEEPVNNRTTITIQLQEEVRNLNEVVVVGYGTVRKRDLTGSVAQVSGKEVNTFPTTNVIQAMQGRAPGVQVLQNTGSPGGSISVRIRGTNSIYGGNEPLYVVDGFPVSGNPTFLQNADIESIDILKDASSIAIYGARGANGVVMITTKSGKKGGRTYVDFETGYTVQMPTKKLKLMNAQQYALFYNEQMTNDNQAPYFTQQQIEEFGKNPGTDWQDLVLHNAPIYSTNLNVSGGNEKTQFSFSTGAFLQDGIVRNSDFDRYSVRTNLSHEISKIFSVSSNLSMVKIKSNRQNSGRGNRGNDLISAMLGAPPTLSPYTQTGAYRRLNTAYPFISNAINNPLTTIDNVTDKIDADRILGNVGFTIKPFKGFSIKISGGVERSTDREDFYARIDTTTSYTGYARATSNQRTSYLSENVATWTGKFGIHGLTATAGFTYQDNVYTTLNGEGTGFISDVTESYNLGLAETPGIPGSYYEKWSMLSYLGRVNYSLLDKYLLTVSFRADGSSRFTDKWGYFPSAALAWRISDEKFFESVKFISDLKLRASYGSVGNPSINPYATLNQLSGSKTIFGDALYNALAPGATLPGKLKWETTSQVDVGFDAALLDNRIRVTFDYYRKETSDLLNKVQLPSSMGYREVLRNVGKVENKGFEIGVDANVLNGPVQWNVSANFTRSRNKVLKLYGGQDILGSSIYTGNLNDVVNLLREGQPMGIFYGYKEIGYNDKGIPVFEDRDKSNSISAVDKTYIGNPNPDFLYGFNSTLGWKGFEFSLFIQGSQGNDIFNLNKAVTLDQGMGLNMPAEVWTDHWTPTNTNAKYPKLTRTLPGNMSSRFVEDGSYLRFKNIQLAYNLPGTAIRAKWLRNAQVYVSAQNMITITSYSWIDPEMNVYGGGNSINQGIDYFSYPTAKSITFGIRCGF